MIKNKNSHEVKRSDQDISRGKLAQWDICKGIV